MAFQHAAVSLAFPWPSVWGQQLPKAGNNGVQGSTSSSIPDRKELYNAVDLCCACALLMGGRKLLREAPAMSS